jgi:hypothetical protein
MNNNQDQNLFSHLGSVAVNTAHQSPIKSESPMFNDRVEQILQDALSDNIKVCAFVFSVSLSFDIASEDTGDIERFLGSLTNQFYTDLRQHEYHAGRFIPCRIRYLWVEEDDNEESCYRVLLLLNRDAYFAIEKRREIEYPMIRRVQTAWLPIAQCDMWDVSQWVRFPANPMLSLNSDTMGLPMCYKLLCNLANSQFADISDDILDDKDRWSYQQ